MAKILIVEDEGFLRGVLTQKLQKEGFETIDAVDGEEGVKKVVEGMPDLILLDLILPGIDGFEALRQIKANQNTAAIPVIILSNLGQKDDIEKALKLGATDFLIKAHFTTGEIISKIQEVLKK